MEIEELIRHSQQGDREAFEKLFNRYKPLVKGLLLKLGNNDFDANDLLQETFIKAFLNIRQYDPAYSFEGWLHIIARNTFLDAIRRKAVKGNILVDSDLVRDIIENDREEPFLVTERKELLACRIGELPFIYRQILEMRYFVGLDYTEIAEELQLPVGTVKTRLHRAKSELKKKITDQHDF